MLSFTPLSITTLLALATHASAHGALFSFQVDGKDYPGPSPYNDAGKPSAVRAVNSIEPVVGAGNPDMNCGRGANSPAALVADAKPGSKIDFVWTDGGFKPGLWPHNIGPIFEYLAPCDNDDCTTFDSKKAEWFKIQEAGRKSGNNGDWVQQDLKDGKTTSVILPSNLAAGEYLLRHEVIGLHVAESRRGAEFYPVCVQIRVNSDSPGSQKLAPSADELVKFPGAYSDDDPGILINVFGPQDKPYPFPGPPIVKSVGNGGGGENDNQPTPTSSPASSPTATQTRPATDTAPSLTKPPVDPCASKRLKKKRRALAAHKALRNRGAKTSDKHHREVLEAPRLLRRVNTSDKHDREAMGKPRLVSRVMRSSDW